jgi:hypothetical protein
VLKNAFIQAFRPGLENKGQAKEVQITAKEVEAKVEKGKQQKKEEKLEEKADRTTVSKKTKGS